ncbi:MAG: c-type cytochrome, methanol metabolism-related, partial [Mesorhizobium sp.]
MSVRVVIAALALALLPLAGPSLAQASDSAEKAKAVTEEDGKHLDAEGNP